MTCVRWFWHVMLGSGLDTVAPFPNTPSERFGVARTEAFVCGLAGAEDYPRSTRLPQETWSGCLCHARHPTS